MSKTSKMSFSHIVADSLSLPFKGTTHKKDLRSWPKLRDIESSLSKHLWTWLGVNDYRETGIKDLSSGVGWWRIWPGFLNREQEVGWGRDKGVGLGNKGNWIRIESSGLGDWVLEGMDVGRLQWVKTGVKSGTKAVVASSAKLLQQQNVVFF